MAITLVDHVTEAVNATPSTLTTNPSADGDLLLALVGVKPTSRTTAAPAMFSGGDHGSQVGGAGVNGTDTGQTRLYCWHRVVDGSEPSSNSLTWAGGTPNPAIQSMIQFHKSRGDAGDWGFAVAFGTDDSQATGADAVDATATSDPGFAAGDLVVVALSTATDNGVLSAPDIIIPGCAVASIASAVSYTTALGNDGGMYVWTGRVTSGTSTGAPSFQCDVDVTANASAGPLAFIRLREPDAPPLGDLAYYDGADWQPAEMAVYNGSAWIT